METERKVVLMGRVSDPGKGQDAASQLDALRGVAKRRGWTVAKELELGSSAWTDEGNSEVWDAVQASLHETGADTLAVWAVDRLTRGGIRDVLDKVEALDHVGVQLYSMQEPFLSTTNPGTRELLLALLGWVSERESARRSERLRAKAEARREQAEQGRRSAKWGRGTMPTPTDARRILALHEAGETYRAIAEETGFSLGTISNVVNGKHPVTAMNGDGSS